MQYLTLAVKKHLNLFFPDILLNLVMNRKQGSNWGKLSSWLFTGLLRV